MKLKFVNPYATPAKPYVEVYTIEDVDTFINNLTLLINQETQRAQAAEQVITNNLNAEIQRATARENAIGALLPESDFGTNNDPVSGNTVSSKLSQETSARQAADIQLQNNITIETNARIAADTLLQNQITAEVTRATAAEQVLTDNLAAEVTRATNRENQIETALNAEIQRAQSEEQRIDAKLDSEITRSTNEDLRLDGKIDAETNRAKAAEQVLTDNLAAEVTRATARENQIETNLNAEISRATAAETVLQQNINAEEAARKLKDDDLQQQIDDHVGDMNNPHTTSLQQASDVQSTQATVLAAGTQGIYEGSNVPGQKLLTKTEVEAIVGFPLRYKGALKFGANTLADMNSIPTVPSPDQPQAYAQEGDLCGCHETQSTYKFTSGSWVQQPPGQDQTGDLYDEYFWYGTWEDGHTYKGEVSAQIKCYDATNHLFDQVVLTDVLLDGEVTDPKIGTRAVTNQPGTLNLIPIAAKTLTAWLQGIRNNLRGLIEGLAAEITRATSAEETLQDNLDAEATARANKDADLQQQLDNIYKGGNYRGYAPYPSSLPATTVASGPSRIMTGDWMMVNANVNGMAAIFTAITTGNSVAWTQSYEYNLPTEVVSIDLTGSCSGINEGKVLIERYGKIFTLRIINMHFTSSGWSDWYKTEMLAPGVIPAEWLPPYPVAANCCAHPRPGSAGGNDNYFPWPIHITLLENGKMTAGRESGEGNAYRLWCGEATWIQQEPMTP